MKWNYRNRLFVFFVFILLLFAGGVILFEKSREKTTRSEVLESKLEGYASMINRGLNLRLKSQDVTPFLDSMNVVLPDAIRFTFIHSSGKVLYDNRLMDTLFVNHSTRPEIVEASKKGEGREIRISDTNQRLYFYYAKKYPHYYIRLALPYDVEVKALMKSDRVFYYYIGLLLLILLSLIYYVSNRFSHSIRKLRSFSKAVEDDKVQSLPTEFPADELGEIGSRIAGSYQQLQQSKKRVALEREKLLQHVQNSQEGLCFYTSTREVEFYNGLFIQYLNVLMDHGNGDPSAFFSEPLFADINKFLNDKERKQSFFDTKVEKQGRWFAVRVTMFSTDGFEVVLNEVTNQEKLDQLKQEMTGNIAHELRTPVTSIRGYLETLLGQGIPEDKREYFLQRAYNQTLTLSDLIQDMSLITKLENAAQAFPVESVNLLKLLSDLKLDFEAQLRENDVDFNWLLPDEMMIKGNYNLLYSIFRNLLENSIRYAGTHIKVRLHLYAQKNNYYYFSFTDNGVGLPSHANLNRLFERFYRVSQGRTRESGGTGLGLSIVKNAIRHHQGDILAKHRLEGGLELLFSLPKA